MLSGWRLQQIAQALAGHKLASWRRFYHLTMTVRALGLVLPRSVSALGGKSVGLVAFGLSLRRSLWAVMVDNLLDVLLLTAVTLPALPFLQNKINISTYLLLYVLSVIVLAGVLWWGSQPGRLNFLLAWLQHWPWLARKLKLEGETAIALLPPPRVSLQALLITFLLNTGLALTAFAVSRAIGLTADWPLFLAIFPITQLSLIIAVAPGGLGVVDFTWAGLLLLVGVTQTDASAFAVAQRIYITLFVLVWTGVSVLLNLTAEKPALQPEIGYHPNNETK
jgi:uncharacterized membrane protein YbhN (UPF0104 family)